MVPVFLDTEEVQLSNALTYPSAVSFILVNTKAPIWLGEKTFPSVDFTHASPLEALTILYDTMFLK